MFLPDVLAGSTEATTMPTRWAASGPAVVRLLSTGQQQQLLADNCAGSPSGVHCSPANVRLGG